MNDKLEAKIVDPPDAYQRTVVLAPTLALRVMVPAVQRWPLVTVGAVGTAFTVPLTANVLVVALAADTSMFPDGVPVAAEVIRTYNVVLATALFVVVKVSDAA